MELRRKLCLNNVYDDKTESSGYKMVLQ